VLLQLLTQGLRGASTNMLGLGVGPRPMAVMPDIKVWAFSAVFDDGRWQSLCTARADEDSLAAALIRIHWSLLGSVVQQGNGL